MDATGKPITAGFCLDVGANADKLGLGSAQLQAISAVVATPSQEESRPMVAARYNEPAIQSGPTKLFVGSIPSGTSQEMIKLEFGKYGAVAEVFLKADNAADGRMWGFVTFVNPESSASAVNALNDQFVFPNSQKPLSVSFARSSNSSTGGLPGGDVHAVSPTTYVAPAATGISGMGGPTKLFIGSIPAGTTKEALIAEFGKFGQVMDIFLKNDNAEPGRMWGFLTYDNSSAAAAAVTNLNERLVLPGGSRPCAISFARNSQAQHSMAAQNLATSAINPVAGATKLFIGTIPQGTTETALRAEFEKYGQVTEIFLKTDSSDANRMWGFLSYVEAHSAAVAVSALHEKLMMPGSVRPLAVSFAKNSGRAGSNTSQSESQVSPGLGLGLAVPPPPLDSASGWKVYYTQQGLPYYNNTVTGITQWECPPEFPGGPAPVRTDPASAASFLALGDSAQSGAAGSPGLAQATKPAESFSSVASIGDSQRYSPF